MWKSAIILSLWLQKGICEGKIGEYGERSEVNLKIKNMDKFFYVENVHYSEDDLLNAISYPNEGFFHSEDEDRLKSVAKTLNKLNEEIDSEAIIVYCQNNNILYKVAYKMIDYFTKAKNTQFKTSATYSFFL